MTAISGAKAQIILTSTPSVSMTNLALADSGDHKTFNVPTAQDAKRYWDSSAAFTFETSPDGTTWTSASPASIRYINGQITFTSAVSGATPSARVATGKYLPWAAIATANEWDPDVERDSMENTTFTTNNVPVRWKTYQAGMLSGSFKVSGFVADDAYLDMITTDQQYILSLVFDVTTGARMDCPSLINKDSLKAPIADLETEELDFQITGEVVLIAA